MSTTTTTTPLQSIVHLDTAWSHGIHTLTSPYTPHALLKLLEFSGDGRIWFPFALSLLLSPISLHSSHLYSLSLSLLLGLFLDIAIVGPIKHLVRRSRPLYNKSMRLSFAVDHWSFPSGHSSRVCLVASLFLLSAADIVAGLEQLKFRKGEIVDRWIGERDDIGGVVDAFVVCAVVWAALTSFSRIVLGRHFVLDVVVGCLLGVFEGFVAYRFLRF